MTGKRTSDADPQPLSASVKRVRKRALTIAAILITSGSLILVIGATVDLDGNDPAATPTVVPGSARPTAVPNVHQVLARAGAAAGDQQGGWAQAAYWHSVSSYRHGSGPLVRREVWAGHRAIGAMTDTRLSSNVIPLQDGRFAGFAWDELYALPTESLALESRLRATSLDGVRDDDTELFALVGNLLRESPAPPALREALWDIAARVPGVTLVGAVKDSSGRSGVAIRRGDHGYVLDPEDGRLFEEYIGTSQQTPSAPGGATWRATYLEQGPANSAPTTE